MDPLVSKQGLWTLSQDEFRALPEAANFRWTSSNRESARAVGSDLRIFALPLVEAVARFEEGHLAQITATIYARGDLGDLPKEQFTALLTTVSTQITKAVQVKYEERGKDASNAVRAMGLVWKTPASSYLLEYSFTREVKSRGEPFRAEFIRLSITPPEQVSRLIGASSSTLQQKFDGRSHVKRDTASGDVFIPDVPMVDQGEKGYCAVACAERVMRYYGIRVDENELAQAANSDSSGGTSIGEMIEALKRLGSRLRIRVRMLDQMDVRQVKALTVDYNRIARHEGKAALPEQSRVIDITATFQAMQPDILRQVRTRSKGDAVRFQSKVQSRIDEGIPLLWTVSLGILPEPGLRIQRIGGHMRLIIGYNNRTNEIIYTDSWGAGHEEKRMPLSDAWTITSGLIAIEPL